MAEDVVVPGLGESVTQAVLIKWHKEDGQAVSQDEPLCELETDKANVDVPAPIAGVVKRAKNEGDTVAVGEVIARIDANGKASAAPKAEQPKAAAKATAPATSETPRAASAVVDDLSPAVRRMVEEHQIDPSRINGSGPNRRITKEDVQKYIETGSTRVSQPSSGPRGTTTESHVPAAPTAKPAATVDYDAQGIRREPMSKIRKRIAERLVSAQQTAAILTTFNEIDMTAVFDLRTRYKERFSEVHGVNLGLMSFFVRATVLALKEFKAVNASIEGDDVVYHNYVHMGIAVSSERGLAVPVLRNVQDMSFARIEAEIKRVAIATREGKLGLDELSGGTFTITNGGVFGSLLSTPIINPPQSGILGMHAVQKRPMAIGDKIEIRPMMYVALSYDHRLVDGRESVSFLVRLKQLVEDPARLMLEI